MRVLNIVLTDREYSALEKQKGRSTWRELIQDIIKASGSVNTPVILENVSEEGIHEELAQKRKEQASDKLFKVNERKNKK